MTPIVIGLAKVSAIIACALATLPLLRHRPAALRHFFLALAILLALLMPALQQIAPGWGARLSAAPTLSGATDSETDRPLELVSSGPRSMPAVPRPMVSIRDVALAIWMLGTSIGIAMLLVGIARLVLIARRAERVHEGPLARLAADLSLQHGVRQLTLLLSPDPTMIGTWGWLRPKVMLPESARHWPEDRARIVLHHELAHVCRRDWIALIVADVFRSVHWFNPLAWVACARLRHESEQACDTEVLKRGAAATDYAAHLLELARATVDRRTRWSPASAIAQPSTLHTRISAMLNGHLNREPISRAAWVVTSALLVAVTIPLAGFGSQDRTVTASASPLARSVSTVRVPPTAADSRSRPASAQSAARPAAAAAAQGQGAVIFGTLYDQSGAALPGATIEITNNATSRTATFESDRLGYYQVGQVPPGTYTIDVSLPGFEYTRRTVTVRAGDSQEQSFTLPIGSIMETVTITDDGQGPAPSADELARRAERLRESLEMLRHDEELARQRRNERAANVSSLAIGGVIKPPRQVFRISPLFPLSLRGTGVAGHVLLQGTINEYGSVQDLRVMESAHPDFSQSALDAVGEWRFTPTTLNGIPVPVTITVSLYYTTR